MTLVISRWSDLSELGGACEPALAAISILVVDDSDINLEITRRMLEINGAKVSLAGNGSAAIELLREFPTDFDVVLMDVQMPELDGYAATRKIRETWCLVDVPVIGLTAGAHISEREQAVASGMDDFIAKPFDAGTLVECILRHIKRGRQAEVCETDDGWPVLHGIDIKDARNRLLGDLSLFMSSLRRFLTEFNDLEALVATPQMQSTTAHAKRMHKLKGMAGMLGANSIQNLAVRVEDACKAANAREASNIGKELCVELGRLRQSAAAALAADSLKGGKMLAKKEQEAMNEERLARLVDMLQMQDLAAVDEFNAMAAALRQGLGRQLFESVRDLMDRLQMIEAADVLNTKFTVEESGRPDRVKERNSAPRERRPEAPPSRTVFRAAPPQGSRVRVEL